jgi:hypothetical protein
MATAQFRTGIAPLLHGDADIGVDHRLLISPGVEGAV